MRLFLLLTLASLIGVQAAEKALTLSVAGLEQPANVKKLKALVQATDGLLLKKTDPSTRLLALTFDDQKTNAGKVRKSLSKSGLKIAGDRTSLKIKGLFCQSCCNHLTSVLGKTEGVVFVENISHLTGLAEITFDPQKTDLAKIKAAVHTTNYKVVEPAVVSPEKDPQS